MSDLISRQEAIDAINSMFAPTPSQKDMVEDCLEIIENLPPASPDLSDYFDKLWRNAYERGKVEAQPERRKGEWIKHIDDLFPAESTLECNVCHHEQPITIDNNYCPNCGTDMRNASEIARDIMHEAIDHTVWSDTVNVEEMHRVVDDKYADMRGKQE